MCSKSVVTWILTVGVGFFTWLAPTLADPSRDQQVTVDHIAPLRFGPGFEISIAGRGFRADDKVKVGRFDLQNAVITPTEIQGTVPKKTNKASRIAVVRGGKTIVTFREFTFTPIPRVVSIHPAFAEPGRKVTLTGEALGTVTRLKIGTRPIVPGSISDNRITFTVPDGTTTGMIALVSPMATIYSQEEFEVFYPPTLTGSDKNSGYPGDTVILMGANLGSSRVFFKLGKQLLKVMSRYPTSATVILPIGARSGRFSATSRGHTDTLATDFTVFPKKASGR
jgi:hypothetical protein